MPVDDPYSKGPDKLLNPPSAPAEVTPVLRTWMNPLNKLKWRAAIKARKTKVTLDDGRSFTLDYDRRPGLVLIKPTTGYAPMGWFNIDHVLKGDGEWIVG